MDWTNSDEEGEREVIGRDEWMIETVSKVRMDGFQFERRELKLWRIQISRSWNFERIFYKDDKLYPMCGDPGSLRKWRV